MCDPVSLTVASVALAAGSAGLSIHGQQQQQMTKEGQKRQMSENERVMAANRKQATEAFISQVRQENLGKQQEQETLALKRDEYSTDAMQAQATARVAAADAGVGGQSLEMLLGDFNRQEAMFMGKLLTNQQFAEQNREERITGYGDQFENRYNSVAPYQPGPVAPVDFISPILGIASSGLNTYTSARRGTNEGRKAAGDKTYYSGEE
jgi:hypothetical protein